MSLRLLVALVGGAAITAVAMAAGGGAGDPAATGGAGEPAAVRCGDWANGAEGRPAARGVNAPSYLVWHDRRGWHLRTVTPAGRAARFRGLITTEGRLQKVRSRRHEGKDAVSRSGRRISFDLRTRGGDIDGFDFVVRCGAVSFALEPRSRPVRLGTSGRAPAGAFTAPDPAGSGVEGKVVTGPTCPVEGPGQDCSPRPVQTTVDAFDAAGEDDPSRAEKSVPTDASGRFRISLAPGRHRLVPRPVGPGATGKPTDVTVTSGVTTEVTLTVDSGLR